MMNHIVFKNFVNDQPLFDFQNDLGVTIPAEGTYWHHGLQTFKVAQIHVEYKERDPASIRIDYMAVYTIYVIPCKDPRQTEDEWSKK